MSSSNREKDGDINGSTKADVSTDRRATLAKIAYGSPAIAALILSKNAAAQMSPDMPIFTPPAPP